MRQTLTLGDWHADYRSGTLTRDGEMIGIEPKVMDLLFLLGSEPGRVFGREEIANALWPRTTVNEDALARCVFKLRRALGDHSRNSSIVETVPKRGYRLVSGGCPEQETLRHAEAFYYQFTRADNEAAIALYERAIRNDATDASALAGLSNCLVQRAVRWLGNRPRSTLSDALETGALASLDAQKLLNDALILSDRAAALRPRDPTALKARGLALIALSRFAEARCVLEQALLLDPKAWSVLVNLADLDGIEGHAARALHNLERAYDAMREAYRRDAVLIRPWHAALGTLIAERHLALGDDVQAAVWYRRVIALAPLNENAIAGLAKILVMTGDVTAARALCLDVIARVGESELCETVLSSLEA
jgi:DNA-binding winged helix-turn-helix (wHTH) protein